MEKHRIIETTTPLLTRNVVGEVDFVPQVLCNKTYHIEQCVFHIFGYFKVWHKVEFYDDAIRTRSVFRSIEEAKAWLKFGEQTIKTKVVAKL